MPFGSSKATILGAAGGAAAPIEGTGGTITTSGDYTLHTFTSSGTFTITAGSGDLWMVAVAAGGGSGHGGSSSSCYCSDLHRDSGCFCLVDLASDDSDLDHDASSSES